MRAAKKITVDKQLLQELVPLNALSQERFRELSEKIIIEEVLSGRFLFRKGDRDNQTIFLLDGKINLIDGFRKVTGEIEAGSDASRLAIAHQQPRALTARAASKSVIARIDSGLLDVFLSWDQSSTAEVVEIGSDDNQDWMTRILQTEAFEKIPPAMIQSLLIKMQPYPVKAGDVVISQGDTGDYFYSIHKGRCAVTRKDTPDSDDQWLAELGDGASFGEDALVSDVKRNATVTMLTDGLLMRLAKEDFVALLKEQLVKRVDYERAAIMVNENAVWVDVRTVDEYAIGSFEDSVNIPLADLRNEMSELAFNTRYVICCDTGRRSESAAFLLSHKGFDVYVLEGGIPEAAAEAVPADLPDTGSQPAVGEAAADAGSVENGAASGATAERDEELAVLRAENEGLLNEVEETRAAGVRANEQLELLRGELGESGEKLGALYAQAKTDAEQLELLRGELGESGEKLGALYVRTDNDAGEIQVLQDQYAALQEQHAGVINSHKLELEELGEQLIEMRSQVDVARDERRVLEEGAESAQEAQQEVQQLKDALEKASEQVSVLESEVVKSDEAGTALLNEAESRLQEQQEVVRQLQDELSAANQTLSDFQEQSRSLESEQEASGKALQEELQAQTEHSGNQQQELDDLRQEIDAATGKLAEESDKASVLETENSGLTKQLEEFQAAAEAGKQELESALSTAKDQHQTLEQQLEDLQASLEKQQQELSAVSEGKEHADGTLQSLQQDNEQLREELRETAQLLEAQKEDAGKQLTDREAVEAALQKQQSEWEAERVALQQATEDERRVAEELRQELEQARAKAGEDKAGLENEQQATLGKLGDQIASLEAESEQLKGEQSSHARELELAATEKEQLQQALNSAAEENSRLESEAESLKEQATTLAEGSAEELQRRQEQLEAEQARAAGLEQSGSDKDVQIRDLQEEILTSGETRGSLEQELESLRKQHDDVQLQLEQQAGRKKELEQEHDESIQKAHEDLTRKNDNEKELQGQIDRLRKKLEQSTADLKKTRESSQADVDNIRDELHAEREARTEERAEMAARQRELKEQLSAIAVEHEAKLTNQSGAIEQARHAGREEEQEQLRDLLEAQNQSEEQVLALQQELQKAHEEVAELTRQEKDRRQVDMEMMQEQNQQAVSTITQLESQLQQLTLDRDAALEEQQVLREKMNTLRGEVEVARGLMNVSSEGHVEDPEKLRRELDESKNNMAIALRLRAEAEAARDQLIEERNALLEKRGEQATGTPLHVPSLDAGETDNGHPEPQPAVTATPVAKESTAARNKDHGLPPLVPVDKDARHRRWLGGAIGLGVVGAAAVAAWLLLGPVNQFSIDWDFGDFGDFFVFEVDSSFTEEAVVAVNEGAEDAEVPVEQAVPGVTDSQPDKPATPPAEVREPVAVMPSPEPVPEAPPEVATPEPPPAPVTAIRTFRDSLKGGSKGPVMVELPANGYLMGSTGNSLNYDEGPRHEVTVPGFSISKHEVTFAKYDKFARATGRRLPNDESWGRGDRPVINVSWNDARAYVKWLSKKTGKKYRLPTEAEWEYAARAGNTEKTWWDNRVDVKPANCFNCGSEWDGKSTAPAGSFKENAFGLHDMAGNAQEWTEDCYHTNYSKAPDDGSAWLTPGCTQRVVRGGGYTSPLDSLRYARRGQYDQDTRLDNIGFRVVRSN